MRRPQFQILALIIVFAIGCGPAAVEAPPPGPAPAPAAGPADDDPPLPLDARLTTGKLANGLTYYILPHTKPEKRANIWLAVNAGSVLEDDDQRGLAHFVEHMGFNGTKRFPKQALIDFIEKSGVRFGADLNAYTSFDETVYMLQVPTDEPELMTKGLSVLRDWADGVAFDADEVEKERGVVLEEWRLGRGAAMRLFDKEAPVLFHGSKYAERMTIGKADTIKGAPRDVLKRFYQDWYRPDLMAVIAVGDFAAADVEKQITSEFSSMAAAKKAARLRPAVPVPPHEATLVSIETDPEQTTTRIVVTSKLPHRSNKSAADYRRFIAEQLWNTMMSERLDEIKRQPNAPFLSGFASASGMVRTADALRQVATVKEDGVEIGLAALYEELLRVERHGFKSTELERARKKVLRGFQQSVKERDKRDARGFSSEIVRHFLREEAMPGPEAELALTEKYLPTYTLEELNAIGKSLGAGSRVISVQGPTKMVKPTADAVLALAKKVEAKDIKPYEDAAPGEPLMAKMPAPGPVSTTKTIPEIGVTEWKLKNGVRIVVKPTTFSNDEVKMSAFSPGGHSLVPDADYDSARFASTIVGQSGIGPLDPVQLAKSLAGKVATVWAQIRELEEGFTGSASPADLETMLQMVHLYFTAPRRDENAFSSWLTRETERVKNSRLSPEWTFMDELEQFSTQNHLRRRMPTVQTMQKVNLDKALSIYQDRFADAGDFTFLFVGNIDLEQLKALSETYLGSLPTKDRKEKWKDPRVSYPKGVQSKTIMKGTEPKSSVSLTFHGPEKWTRDAENDIKMLQEVLSMRLREILREDMGGVYGVRVSGAISRRPKQEFALSVSFGCSPDNIEKLQKAVFEEAKSIQDKGIGDDYIAKVKELRRRVHETNLKENTFWLRELERAYVYGDDPKLIPDIKEMTNKVTSDRVKAAANKYLTSKQYVLGILKPEGAIAADSSSAIPPKP